MKHTILSFAVVFSILFFFGCKDEDTLSGSEQTGDLTGQVVLLDSNEHYVQDKSGVTIQIEGTSFSALTDTGGYWTIKNLPSATYSLSFSKPTYNTWKNTSFEFVGGGLTWFGMDFPINGSTVRIEQSPTFTIFLDSIGVAGGDSGIVNTDPSIYGRFSTPTTDANRKNLRVFISRNPNLIIDDPSTCFSYTDFQVTNWQYQSKTADGFKINIPSQFYLTGIAPGEKLYVRAYPMHTSGLGGYYDVKTHKTIRYGYGTASNVVSFIH